ncbi:hypothetical protein [Ralstonia pseudosolanacearum]|uniref:hypothetical protein n=1 Tax=Ralstonia pseudosolanacearum TaxID=1310165 RepID=UPI003CF5B1FC
MALQAQFRAAGTQASFFAKIGGIFLLDKSMNGLARIDELCVQMRGIFEQVLSTSQIEGTAGSCLHASILLQQALDKFGDCETVVRGGDGSGDGGARDMAGQWRGHYWVEGVTKDGCPFLADITADQFGWPPVVVMPLETARTRYSPGNDQIAGDAVADELERMLQHAAHD